MCACVCAYVCSSFCMHARVLPVTPGVKEPSRRYVRTLKLLFYTIYNLAVVDSLDTVHKENKERLIMPYRICFQTFFNLSFVFLKIFFL